jgi:hypothetical protein
VIFGFTFSLASAHLKVIPGILVSPKAAKVLPSKSANDVKGSSILTI